MACGVLCAVTDLGDSALIVGDNGGVASPSNPQALAEAWEAFLQMGPAARAESSAVVRRRIQDHCSLPTMVSRCQ